MFRCKGLGLLTFWNYESFRKMTVFLGQRISPSHGNNLFKTTQSKKEKMWVCMDVRSTIRELDHIVRVVQEAFHFNSIRASIYLFIWLLNSPRATCKLSMSKEIKQHRNENGEWNKEPFEEFCLLVALSPGSTLVFCLAFSLTLKMEMT